MSEQITTHQVIKWGDTIHHIAQQMGSKLLGAVSNKGKIEGKSWTYEQLGATTMRQLTGRATDTEYTDTPFARRHGVCVPYVNADLISEEDVARVLNDPTAKITQAFGFAEGRTIDDVIIAAMNASVPTGELITSGSTSFPSTQRLRADATVASDGSSDTGTGLTTTKLIRARTKLLAADMPEDGLCLAVHPLSLTNLLATTKVGSNDYNAVKSLVEGSIMKWMGFTFYPCTRVGFISGSTTVRANWAFHKSAIEFAMNQAPTHTIDRMPGKNNAVQVYSKIDIGAIRTQEVAVVQIDCQETAAVSDT